MQKGKENDLTLNPAEPLQWEVAEVTDFLFFPIPFNKKHQPLFIGKLQYAREKVRTGCVENGYVAVNRMKRSLLSRTCYLSCRKVAFYLQWCLQDVDP